MKTVEEEQAWEVVEDCASQMNVGGMGGVPIGVSFRACLQVAEERGYDTKVLTYLLPAVTAGMLKAIREQMKQNAPSQ